MKADKHIKREHYDRFYRDKESKKFYQSAQWRKVREMKLWRDPLCETCLQAGRDVVANMVHHMIPIKKKTKKVDLDFLVSLCHTCHNQIESEMERERNRVDGKAL
jgi:5-methylcytosine-specific restriction protein A